MTEVAGRLTLGRVGAGLLVALTIVAAGASWLAPFEPDALVGPPLSPPSTTHWLGTDDLGQDILSALIHGTRLSLAFGVTAAALAAAVAAFVGLWAGYARGVVDMILMRLVDAVLTLPVLPLTIVLGAFLGAGAATQLLVVVLVMWARPARELRAQALSVRERGEVQAALAMGGSGRYVITRHVVPRTLPLLVPQFVRLAKAAIMLEASLSFLGLGDPTAQSWGTMLYYAQVRSAFLTDAWAWWVIPPGLCIAMTVVGFAFVGYAVEERTRPVLRPVEKRHAGAPPLTRDERPAPDRDALLAVHSLTVDYESPAGRVRALDGVTLEVNRGEVVGIVGESGSGKTTLAHAILGMLDPPARVAGGAVYFEGHDMLAATARQRCQILGSRLALIPQSAMNALNPVYRVCDQVAEVVTTHTGAIEDAGPRAADALRTMGIPPDRLTAYPHEFSGGMRQRVVFAMALVNHPALIVADEVTSGLDVVIQAEILRLIATLRARRDLTMIFISHDLPAVIGLADRLVVMRGGRVVETGPTATVISAPLHPYSRALLDTLPQQEPEQRPPPPADPAVLEVTRVVKVFGGRRAAIGEVRAVDDVSFDVRRGEVVALVGGSGAGKSTIARLIAGLERPDAGEIRLHETDLATLKGRARLDACRRRHLIFQDPYQSLAPHWRVVDIVAEPLGIHGLAVRAGRERLVVAALEAVALVPADRFLRRFPHELSGGERQRVALARAAVHEPELIVADEPTSMLDASLRLDVVKAMEALRERLGTAFLYITHDLALAQRFGDRILIMRDGRIVERGDAGEIVAHPAHEYTAALVDAAFPGPPGRADSTPPVDG